MRNASDSKLLDVWWLDGDRFFGPVDVLDGKTIVQYGDYLQVSVDHYDAWRTYAPMGLRDGEYDILPRGRVMFNCKIHKFVVVGPSDLVFEPGFQSAIENEYGLPHGGTVYESDEHYD